MDKFFSLEIFHIHDGISRFNELVFADGGIAGAFGLAC